MAAMQPARIARLAALQTATRRRPARLTFSPGDLPIAQTLRARQTADRERSGTARTLPRREPGLLQSPGGSELPQRKATGPTVNAPRSSPLDACRAHPSHAAFLIGGMRAPARQTAMHEAEGMTRRRPVALPAKAACLSDFSRACPACLLVVLVTVCRCRRIRFLPPPGSDPPRLAITDLWSDVRGVEPARIRSGVPIRKRGPRLRSRPLAARRQRSSLRL